MNNNEETLQTIQPAEGMNAFYPDLVDVGTMHIRWRGANCRS